MDPKVKKEFMDIMKQMKQDHENMNQLLSEKPIQDPDMNQLMGEILNSLETNSKRLVELPHNEYKLHTYSKSLDAKIAGFLSDLNEGAPYPIPPSLRWKKIRQACHNCHSYHWLHPSLLQLEKYPPNARIKVTK